MSLARAISADHQIVHARIHYPMGGASRGHEHAHRQWPAPLGQIEGRLKRLRATEVPDYLSVVGFARQQVAWARNYHHLREIALDRYEQLDLERLFAEAR